MARAGAQGGLAPAEQLVLLQAEVLLGVDVGAARAIAGIESEAGRRVRVYERAGQRDRVVEHRIVAGLLRRCGDGDGRQQREQGQVAEHDATPVLQVAR
jgi:hypothetical protein